MSECYPSVSILVLRGEKLYTMLPKNYINRRIILQNISMKMNNTKMKLT
jgi:hypothetical protein